MRCACFALVCLALAVRPAMAQEPVKAAPSAADKETARTLARDGNTKFEAGDFAGALKDFQGADLIMGAPSTRLAVGKAQEKLGKLLEARDTYLGVARIPKAPSEPEAFVTARSEAERLAAALAARIPSLKLTTAKLPAEATLSVDGEPIASALWAVPRKVNPGEHRLQASATGQGTFDKVVKVIEGEEKEIVIELEQPTAAAPPSPPKPAPPPPADASTSRRISPVAWVGFGLGAAGLIAGGVTGGLAAAKASDLKSRCPDNRCTRATTEADLSSAYTLSYISTAGFVTAGVGLTLGLVGLFALGGGKAEAPKTVGIVPVVGPGGFSLLGTF